MPEVPAGFELQYTEGDNLPFYQKIADVPQQPLPVDASAMTFANSSGSVGIDKLLGVGGQERYQTWPERMVRDAVSAPHEVLNNPLPVTTEDLIKPAMDVSALAGVGSMPMASKGALGSFGGKLVQVEHDPFAASNAPTFYSALEKAVDANPQSKMSGEQWLGTIRNSKGVKPEELEYSGLEGFLADKKAMTKSEVQDFIKNNKIELGETVKGVDNLYGDTANIALNEYRQKLIDKYGNGIRNKATPEELKVMDNLNDRVMQNNPNPTKFHQYQLPGGSNYREVLMTLPHETGYVVTSAGEKAADYRGPKTFATKAEAETELANRQLGSGYHSIMEAPKDAFRSSHWDEPNVIAHMRMNDRMIDGKKSLHIEEAQSDWHQTGRNTGYKLTPEQRLKADAIDEKLLAHPDAERIMGNPDLNAALKEAVDKKIITQSEATAYEKVAKNENATVPDAPFKKNWHDLVLKRALREAAEKGYDRLSWTPGEAQAARYDLSKQIDNVRYYGDKRLVAFDKNGAKVFDKEVAPKDLSDTIGKDAAEKLVNSERKKVSDAYSVGMNLRDVQKLENADLKIGGEGMKGFYDQIIPKAVQKLTGEKVKTTKINLANENELSQKLKQNGFDPENVELQEILESNGGRKPIWMSDKDILDFENGKHLDLGLKKEPIHYIDIPQKLKDEALQKGFPLFSSSPVMVPVDGDPFKEHKFTPVEHNPFE